MKTKRNHIFDQENCPNPTHLPTWAVYRRLNEGPVVPEADIVLNVASETRQSREQVLNAIYGCMFCDHHIRCCPE